MKAGGKPIEWRRDPEDMYAFVVELPWAPVHWM